MVDMDESTLDLFDVETPDDVSPEDVFGDEPVDIPSGGRSKITITLNQEPKVFHLLRVLVTVINVENVKVTYIQEPSSTVTKDVSLLSISSPLETY